MGRALSYILVFAAMIVQIGMGVLPAGESCLCIPIAPAASDCCCGESEAGNTTADRACPCQGERKTCICVPRSDNQAALNARHQPTKFGNDGAIAAFPPGPPE